jgi:hypothetical protein
MIACGLLVMVGCGMSDARPDIPGYMPGMPGAGAHALNYYGQGATSASSISVPVMATQPSGSTIVVGVGRGIISQFVLPTDNKGNAPYQQQGVTHSYSHYPTSGTALYAFPSAKGGSDFKVSAGTGASDEITLAAVEVIEGTRIAAYAWNEVVQDQGQVPVTSKTVTTTGPATLVAFWWGDAPVPDNKTAVPNNGFVVVDSILAAGALVQCAVAVKNVIGAGTYDVTWTATPVQGAQLWLIAVQ